MTKIKINTWQHKLNGYINFTTEGTEVNKTYVDVPGWTLIRTEEITLEEPKAVKAPREFTINCDELNGLFHHARCMPNSKMERGETIYAVEKLPGQRLISREDITKAYDIAWKNGNHGNSYSFYCNLLKALGFSESEVSK